MADKNFKIISHRGNLDGPDPDLENKLEHLEIVLSSTKFDIEIDLRVIDGLFLLGHDFPDESVTLNFLLKHRDRLWIHCKNLEAYNILSRYRNYGCFTFNFFFHDRDPYALTSTGWIWGFPNSEAVLTDISPRYVHVFNEDCTSHNWESMRIHHNICTDYPLFYE